METPPIVSILCATYNHANFIKKALDGFLSQQTSFPVEIIVRDDASTDGTSEILREYERDYPERFRNIYEVENQYSKGIRHHASLFSKARGKYVALCEGDDYWTDYHKLQKQVDFLEANPDFSFCGAVAASVILTEGKPTQVGADIRPRVAKNTYDTSDVMYTYLCHTSTFLLRSSVLTRAGWILDRRIFNVDEAILAACSKFGKLHVLDDAVSCMRRHAGGIWTGRDPIQGLKHSRRSMQLINERFDNQYCDEINQRFGRDLKACHESLLLAGDYLTAARLLREYHEEISSLKEISAIKMRLRTRIYPALRLWWSFTRSVRVRTRLRALLRK